MATPDKLIELLTGKVFKVRGVAIVFGFDAAALYEVDITVLHRAVTKHSQRFPPDFMFWLTQEEWRDIAEQISPALYTHKKLPPLAHEQRPVYVIRCIEGCADCTGKCAHN